MSVYRNMYWDNGKLHEHYFVNDKGNIDGPYIVNHHDGTPRIRANFKNGKYHGKYETFLENGQRESCYHDVDNFTHGIYQNGKLQILYEHGELITQLKK